MIGRRLTLALAGLGLAAVSGIFWYFSGCGEVCHFGQSNSFIYRYRLSLEVATPEGLKRGSGVLQVHAFDYRGLAGDRGGAETYGEAVAVDLGPRGSLFALLKREYTGRSYTDEFSADVLARAHHVERGRGNYVPFARRVAAIADVVEVHPADLPMLVRFRDINNPATVEKVDPNNLAKSFGAGVKLQRATLQITSDPVTTGIEKRLGWLDGLKTGTITGLTMFDPAKPDPINYLEAVTFRYGTQK